MGGKCRSYGVEDKCVILVGKPEEKKSLLKRYRKLEDRIQMGFKEMCCGKIDFIEVTKNLAR
jgi:hypothetical protein